MSSRSRQNDWFGSPSGGIAVRLALICVLVGAVVGVAIYADYRNAVAGAVLEQGESVDVAIPEGAAWPKVLDVLVKNDLVDHPRYIDLWARRRGLPSAVKAGTYRLRGPMTLSSLAEALRDGVPARDVEVTFREGATIFHLADRVEQKGLAERSRFLEAARDPDLLERADLDADSFEGYLFPETYRFAEEVSAEDIVWRMHREWKQVWGQLVDAHPDAFGQLRDRHGIGRHGIVTLASIVEAETGAASERPLVARVMLNRLDASMRLQVDPTCVYGEESYDEVPTPSDCRDPMNRYSTYVVDGLPPGPIGNPGRSSLEAALLPADGEDAEQYLYFVARRDGSGEHVFSSSYREHKRKVRKHLE